MRFADFIDFVRQWSAQIREAWRQLSSSARVNLVLAGLAVAALITYVAFFVGGETRYITLADNLTAQQFSEIVALLESRGVEYHPDETSRSIGVLPKDRSRMLLELEQNNLPVGQSVPSGFEELFSTPDFMSNQWFNDVNYLRAVQGELQKQLTLFEFVDFAQVLIREADNEYFVEEQIPSEASVVLKVNRPVTPRETKLIVSMVSRAGGANLNPNNITVSTTEGVDLHLPTDSKFAAIANDKLEFQDSAESRIQKKIMDSLRPMGVKASVTVGAQINFDEQETTESMVTEGTALSELETKQDIESQERLPEGAPGALQNVPEAAAAPGGTTTTDSMSETLTNYEPSRKTTTIRTDPGNVVRYKVALVVQGDDVETVTDAEGNETQQYNGLSEKTRLACLAIAESAVAAENAGADIQVVDHPYVSAGMDAVTAAIEGQRSSEMLAARQSWISMAITLLGIIVGLYFVRWALNKSIIHPSEEKKEEEVREIPEATLEDMRRQEVAAEIAQLSLNDPEAVAALLRSWMSETEE